MLLAKITESQEGDGTFFDTYRKKRRESFLQKLEPYQRTRLTLITTNLLNQRNVTLDQINSAIRTCEEEEEELRPFFESYGTYGN